MTSSPSRTGHLTLSGKTRAKSSTGVYDPFRPATIAELIAYNKRHNMDFSHIYNIYSPALILPQIEPDQNPIHDESIIPCHSTQALCEIPQSTDIHLSPRPRGKIFAAADINEPDYIPIHDELDIPEDQEFGISTLWKIVTEPIPALTEAIRKSIPPNHTSIAPSVVKMQGNLLISKPALVKAPATLYHDDEPAQMPNLQSHPLFGILFGRKRRVERVKKNEALEQEYHLFNHAHENVAVRPSS